MSGQGDDLSDELTTIDNIKILIMAILCVLALSFAFLGNFLWLIMSVIVLFILFVSLGSEEGLKGLFNDELEPGAETLKSCPNCGEDKIYRTATTATSMPKYFCDACGYEADKEEVEKSFTEMVMEKQNGGETSVGKIENEKLREEVKDRIDEGWELEEVDNSNGKVILKTTKGGTIGGHALTGITTGLWTFGAGNVVYGKLSKKRNAERMVLREKDNLPRDAGEPIQLPDTSDRLRKLKDLNDEDVITDEEFERKKAELLENY